MNFGFDIDGTISGAPEAFRAIMRCLVMGGNEVHVITGGLHPHPATKEQIKARVAQLRSFGLLRTWDYTRLHCVNGVTIDEVAEGKRQVCKDHEIVLMFEDSPQFTDVISQVTQCLLMV